MRRLFTTLAAFSCFALVSSAQTAYVPPPPGTMITWSYRFDDTTIAKLSQVVASGSDFVIYDADLRYDTGTPGDYLVEFSGIHTQTCDQKLLSEQDRSALARLWPFDEGSAASVSGEVAAMYVIRGSDIMDFISPQQVSNVVRKVDGQIGDGENRMSISVSTAYGMPVQIAWSAGGSGQVLEIVEPQGSTGTEEIDPALLGACAELVR